MGFDTMGSTTPIIPILIKDPQRAVAMSKRLLQEGIFVQAIRPPTVPMDTARLRLTVTATHTQDDLLRLLNALKVL
jgi:glycine C-acetyltransferase